MITASYLFMPEKHNNGNNKCFYCGLLCDGKFQKSEYVKNTFTNRDIVKYPNSDFVCGCCVQSLITGWETTLIDGDKKTGRGGSPRMFSWVLSLSGNVAFSKRHLDYARNILTDPPDPPFSIIFADSGQKQLIFRAPVNYNKEIFTVMLEDKFIEVDNNKYKIYLEIATICSAAIGKIALKNPEEFNNYKNIIEFYGSEKPLEEWIKIYSTPIGELVAWLCAGKEEAQKNGNVISRRIPEKISGSGRHIETAPGDGRKNNQGGGDQILFNFT